MKYLIAVFAVLFMTGTAFANGSETGHNNGNGHSRGGDITNRNVVNNTVDNHTVNRNINTNEQDQNQRQNQRQHQSQSSEQANTQDASTASSASISIKERRQAPSIGGLASGPCSGSSGGITGPIGGLMFASIDDECTKREDARVLYMLGERELAKKVLMSLDTVKSVLAKERRIAMGHSDLPIQVSTAHKVSCVRDGVEMLGPCSK